MRPSRDVNVLTLQLQITMCINRLVVLKMTLKQKEIHFSLLYFCSYVFIPFTADLICIFIKNFFAIIDSSEQNFGKYDRMSSNEIYPSGF